MERRINHGVSAAAMLERHFDFIFKRFGVTVLDGRVAVTDLTTTPYGSFITVRQGAPYQEVKEQVAVQLGFLALGFTDHLERLGTLTSRNFKEYRQAEKWGSELLIPDAAMLEALRLQWDHRMLAHECDVSVNMARVRAQYYERDFMPF